MYLAEHRESHEKYAIKAIQKKKLKDYTTFINEINILKVLVSVIETDREIRRLLTNTLLKSVEFDRTIRISSSCTRSGSGMTSAFLS